MFTFCFQVLMWLCSPVGAQPLVFPTPQPFGVYPWQAFVPPGVCLWPMPQLCRVVVPFTASNRGASSYKYSCSPVIQSIWWGIQLWGWGESHLTHLLSLHGRYGSSFPGLVPSNDTVTCASMLAIKPCDSYVVIGYQVHKYTQTW